MSTFAEGRAGCSVSPTIPTHILTYNGWNGYLASGLYPKIPATELTFGSRSTILEQVVQSPKVSPIVLLHFNVSCWTGVIDNLDAFVKSVEQAGGTIWNSSIRDIRKSSIQKFAKSIGLSTTLISKNVDRFIDVIIKTNVNALGRPELRLDDATLQKIGFETLRQSPVVEMSEYLVMPLQSVPSDMWNSPHLAIERFINCSEGLFYRVFFAGNRSILCEGRSDAQIKRMETASDRLDFSLRRDLAHDSITSALLGSLRKNVFKSATLFANAFGLDFGSLDLVVDDDKQAYVVDVNPTPYWSRKAAVAESFIKHLVG